MTIFEELKRRGLIAQMTNEEKIKEKLEKEKVTFYIGFDATADSLHVGHFLQLVTMSRLQKAGHRPIVLLGTGTTLVGDPTGKTDMRKMLTPEQIDHNSECFRRQMERFLDFSEDDGAILARNGDWLCQLNYIQLLREVGVHFSVNRMLTAECFKSRMERGLSFLEFNYMIMQSYDFLKLYRMYGCTMEMGGDDQWSNILGGMTYTLLTTKEGKKMGKTEKGAVWLDAEKTSPYEFFQYWRNVDDADVINCLKLLTFLPVEEIEAMESWQGSELNKAKEILAYEVTRMVHGQQAADESLQAARAIFSAGTDAENMPTTEISKDDMTDDAILVTELLVKSKLAPSKGEAKRLIQQGGISVDDQKVGDFAAVVSLAQFDKGYVILRKGKKVYHKILLK